MNNSNIKNRGHKSHKTFILFLLQHKYNNSNKIEGYNRDADKDRLKYSTSCVIVSLQCLHCVCFSLHNKDVIAARVTVTHEVGVVT